MPGKNENKTFFIFGAIIAVAVVVYFIFFYKKSAYQIASDLGLYTGNTGDDQTLDTLINQILSGGGAIATTNLEWELNDAAIRYRNGDVISSAKVNGRVIPASALLTTVDATHDWKNGSPDGIGTPAKLTQGNIDRYDELIQDEGMTPTEAAEYYSADLGFVSTTAEFEQAREILASNPKPGDAYIPQLSLSNCWNIVQSYASASGNSAIIYS